MFPVSSDMFGDVAVDAMDSAYQVLAKSSLNIEKHGEIEEQMVNCSLPSNAFHQYNKKMRLPAYRD